MAGLKRVADLEPGDVIVVNVEGKDERHEITRVAKIASDATEVRFPGVTEPKDHYLVVFKSGRSLVVPDSEEVLIAR